MESQWVRNKWGTPSQVPDPPYNSRVSVALAPSLVTALLGLGSSINSVTLAACLSFST